jgi:hypothetical protein
MNNNVQNFSNSKIMLDFKQKVDQSSFAYPSMSPEQFVYILILLSRTKRYLSIEKRNSLLSTLRWHEYIDQDGNILETRTSDSRFLNSVWASKTITELLKIEVFY